MTAKLTTLTAKLNCACDGTRVYDLVGWNELRKPVLNCRDCGERVVAPLGAMEPGGRAAAHRAARGEADD